MLLHRAYDVGVKTALEKLALNQGLLARMMDAAKNATRIPKPPSAPLQGTAAIRDRERAPLSMDRKDLYESLRSLGRNKPKALGAIANSEVPDSMRSLNQIAEAVKPAGASNRALGKGNTIDQDTLLRYYKSEMEGARHFGSRAKVPQPVRDLVVGNTQRLVQPNADDYRKTLMSGRHQKSDAVKLRYPMNLRDSDIPKRPGFMPKKLVYRGGERLGNRSPAHRTIGNDVWTSGIPDVSLGYADKGPFTRLWAYDHTQIPKAKQGPFTQHLSDAKTFGGNGATAATRGTSPVDRSPFYEKIIKRDALAKATPLAAYKRIGPTEVMRVRGPNVLRGEVK